MKFDLRACNVETVQRLCETHHGYASAGGCATYAFAVYEKGAPIAAYAWQPPPPGAAQSVCPEAPAGVLALSRMVAIPKNERALKHVSKPLQVQMKRLIDRTRWPVLVTYSDEGQGHNGYVYQCSGWTPTKRAEREFFVNADGARASSYANGKSGQRDLTRGGETTLQRWEHWVCERGKADIWMRDYGWRRIPLDRKWRSGKPAYTWAQVGDTTQLPLFGVDAA